MKHVLVFFAIALSSMMSTALADAPRYVEGITVSLTYENEPVIPELARRQASYAYPYGRVYRDQTDNFGEVVLRAPVDGFFSLALRGLPREEGAYYTIDDAGHCTGEVFKVSIELGRQYFALHADACDLHENDILELATLDLRGNQRVRVYVEQFVRFDR